MIFTNRRGAGRQLGLRLAEKYANRDDVVVLALPRGGVPVGLEVAEAINAPLDVFVVRRVGVPGQEELALGAIATGGTVVYNEEILSMARVPESVLDYLIDEQTHELIRREQFYRGDRPPLSVKGKTVIVVDDGLATGTPMRAAVRALREQEAGEIVVAVPVGSAETVTLLRKEADEVVCLATPEHFRAVSIWYVDFPKMTDEEVSQMLEQAAGRVSAVT